MFVTRWDSTVVVGAKQLRECGRAEVRGSQRHLNRRLS
jgi:hypothetical protein